MNEIQAYPCGRTYEARLKTSFELGDRVLVGPAYRMGGEYVPDCVSGSFYIVGGTAPFYRLSIHAGDDTCQYQISASRLSLENFRTESGYTGCACRDCFEIAIGIPGEAMCHACETADCDPDSECQADGAYGVDEFDACGHG